MPTLVIISHPNLASLVANSMIIEQLKKSSYPIICRQLDLCIMIITSRL